jgi:signal peptidase I
MAAAARIRPLVVPVGRGLATLLTGAALVVAVAVLVPAVAGLQRYVITSGSMTGTYDRGSLVYDETVPVADLRVGDVITYSPPGGQGPGGLVTHRIVRIDRAHDGTRSFRTQGDANPAPDPWSFRLDAATQARVVAHVPYVGYALAALSDRRVRMLAVALPAIVIALLVVASTWREAGVEARRRELAQP